MLSSPARCTGRKLRATVLGESFVHYHQLIWRLRAVLRVGLENAEPKPHRVRLRLIDAQPELCVDCFHGVRNDVLHYIRRALALNEQFHGSALPHLANALPLNRRQRK